MDDSSSMDTSSGTVDIPICEFNLPLNNTHYYHMDKIKITQFQSDVFQTISSELHDYKITGIPPSPSSSHISSKIPASYLLDDIDYDAVAKDVLYQSNSYFGETLATQPCHPSTSHTLFNPDALWNDCDATLELAKSAHERALYLANASTLLNVRIKQFLTTPSLNHYDDHRRINHNFEHLQRAIYQLDDNNDVQENKFILSPSGVIENNYKTTASAPTHISIPSLRQHLCWTGGRVLDIHDHPLAAGMYGVVYGASVHLENNQHQAHYTQNQHITTNHTQQQQQQKQQHHDPPLTSVQDHFTLPLVIKLQPLIDSEVYEDIVMLRNRLIQCMAYTRHHIIQHLRHSPSTTMDTRHTDDATHTYHVKDVHSKIKHKTDMDTYSLHGFLKLITFMFDGQLSLNDYLRGGNRSLCSWKHIAFFSRAFITHYALGIYDAQIVSTSSLSNGNLLDLHSIIDHQLQQAQQQYTLHHENSSLFFNPKNDSMQLRDHRSHRTTTAKTNLKLTSTIHLVASDTPTTDHTTSLPTIQSSPSVDYDWINLWIQNHTTLKQHESVLLQQRLASFINTTIIPVYTRISTPSTNRSKKQKKISVIDRHIMLDDYHDRDVDFWFQWRGYCRIYDWAFTLVKSLDAHIQHDVMGRLSQAEAWSDMVATWNVGLLARARLSTLFPHCFGTTLTSSHTHNDMIDLPPLACILMERIQGNTFADIHDFLNERNAVVIKPIYRAIKQQLLKDLNWINHVDDHTMMIDHPHSHDEAKLRQWILDRYPWHLNTKAADHLAHKGMLLKHPITSYLEYHDNHSSKYDTSDARSYRHSSQQQHHESSENQSHVQLHNDNVEDIVSLFGKVAASRMHRYLMTSDAYGVYGLYAQVNTLYAPLIPNLSQIEPCVAMWAQFVVNLAIAQSYLGFSQNDKHAGNIAVTATNYKHLVWKLRVRRQNHALHAPLRGRSTQSFNRYYTPHDHANRMHAMKRNDSISSSLLPVHHEDRDGTRPPKFVPTVNTISTVGSDLNMNHLKSPDLFISQLDCFPETIHQLRSSVSSPFSCFNDTFGESSCSRHNDTLSSEPSNDMYSSCASFSSPFNSILTPIRSIVDSDSNNKIHHHQTINNDDNHTKSDQTIHDDDDTSDQIWTEHWIVVPTHGFLGKLFDYGLSTTASRHLPLRSPHNTIPSRDQHTYIPTLQSLLDPSLKKNHDKRNEIVIGHDKMHLPVYAAWNTTQMIINTFAMDKHPGYFANSLVAKQFLTQANRLKHKGAPYFSSPVRDSTIQSSQQSTIPKLSTFSTSNAPPLPLSSLRSDIQPNYRNGTKNRGPFKKSTSKIFSLEDLLNMHFNGSFVMRDQASGIDQILSFCHLDLSRRLFQLHHGSKNANMHDNDQFSTSHTSARHGSLDPALQTPEFELLRMLTADLHNRCAVWHAPDQDPTISHRVFTTVQENANACASTWDPALLIDRIIRLYEQPEEIVMRDYINDQGVHTETSLFTSVDLDLSENVLVRYE